MCETVNFKAGELSKTQQQQQQQQQQMSSDKNSTAWCIHVIRRIRFFPCQKLPADVKGNLVAFEQHVIGV